MSQFESRPPKENKPPRNGGGNDPNFNWRGIILIVFAISLLLGALALRNSTLGGASTAAKNNEFMSYLQNDEIDKEKGVDMAYDEGYSPQGMFTLTCSLKPGTKDNPAVQPLQIHTTVYSTPDDSLQKALKEKGIPFGFTKTNNTISNLLLTFGPIAAVLLVLYLLFRQQIRMASKGAMSFGKSKARMLARDKNKITFKDVAGVEEAKDEVQELVEFLRDPKKFQKLGGRIPKGVLMVGPPGTGKTLLARAIAGEADVPFFSISGSDFVEMFVGVGASRVRDMFEQGKKSAPCIIFIDEIDAVGRHRGHGLGGGHDEREQTLNALLVEMDGFDTQEGVIIIAATNRPDVLDPALLRPGRFDRQVTVNLPDVKGREEILRVHARKVKLAEGVDLSIIARGTPGFSGAELANLINEAALLAARKGLKGITNAQLEEARDKVRWGRERRSMAMSEKEKTTTAWHEAGHALVNVLLTHTDPLHKVSIIPRGRALGVTMFLPEDDQHNMRQKEAIDLLAVTAGGRIAEELFTEDVSSGAAGDIKQMTHLARVMVCEWGMSEKLGMVEYGDHEEHVFLGRDFNRSRAYSESTAQDIDREVRKLIDGAYARAKELIITNRDKVESIAKALLEYETLDGSQVREIMEHGHMLNPPPPPTAPPQVQPPPLPTKDIAPEFPHGLTESPA